MHGNANSKLTIIGDQITKHYDYNSLNGRKRYAREIKYYNFLAQVGLHNHAPSIRNFIQCRSLTMVYIKDAKTPSVEHFIPEFSSFLEKLLAYKNEHILRQLPLAQEAMINDDALLKYIQHRFYYVKQNELMPDSELRFLESHITSKSFDTSEGLIVPSPSDIGPHNCLVCNKKILFFDFEYAGRDNLHKLLMDLLLHPSMEIAFWDDDTFIFYALEIIPTLSNETLAKLMNLRPAFSILWMLRLATQIDRLKKQKTNSSPDMIRSRKLAFENHKDLLIQQ